MTSSEVTERQLRLLMDRLQEDTGPAIARLVGVLHRAVHVASSARSQRMDETVVAVARAADVPVSVVWGVLAGYIPWRPPTLADEDGMEPTVKQTVQAICAYANTPALQAEVYLRDLLQLNNESQEARAAFRELRAQTALSSDSHIKPTVSGDAAASKRRPRASRAIDYHRALPDAPGHACQPDPFAATTVEQFVCGLGRLQRWAGKPALRELARRSRGRVAHSTLSVMLNNNTRLPEYQTMLIFLETLGLSETDIRGWVTVWRELDAAADLTGETGTGEADEEKTGGAVLRLTGT